jgi:hypothetical protein
MSAQNPSRPPFLKGRRAFLNALAKRRLFFSHSQDTGALKIDHLVKSQQKDGFVKSPSAALRFNFVVAAPKGPHSSVFARLAFGAFYETIKI